MTMQQRILSLLLVAVTIGVVLSSASGFSNGNKVQPAPAKIAFINLAKIFDSSNRKKAMEEKTKELVQARQQALLDIEKGLTAMQDRLKMIKQNSDEFRKIAMELVGKEAQLKFRRSQAEKEVAAIIDEFERRHIAEIQTHVETFAKTHGFDMIFQKAFPTNENSSKFDLVFYGSPDLDVTEMVISLVNGKQ